MVDLRYHTIQSMIEDVEAGNFTLPPNLLNVEPPIGYSSPKVRELLNRLVSLNSVEMTYLEIGVHTGSTFFAAIHHNESRAVAIDNWSLSTDLGPPGGARDMFMKSLAKVHGVPRDRRRVSYIEGDCFAVDLSKVPAPVTIYFYDGDHSRTAQYQALSYFEPVLADRFVYVVDDFNWIEPHDETYRAIKDLGMHIEHEWLLHSTFDRDMVNWWNGLFVGILEKGKR